MKLVPSVLADLVERRLWPVALVLVAALVAIPVVLARPAADAPPPPPASPPAKLAPDADAVVALTRADEPRDSRSVRRLRAKDPFRQQARPRSGRATVVERFGPTVPAPARAPVSALAPAPVSTSTRSQPALSAPATGEASVRVVRRSPAPRRRTARITRAVDLRFGDAERRRLRRDVARLTALPSAARPVLVYLGVLRRDDAAVFVVAPGTQVVGEGRCRSRSACDLLVLEPGDTVFLDVPTGPAASEQYQLHLVRIRRDRVRSARAARRSYKRVSRLGRAALRERLGSGGRIEPLRYSTSTGTLHVLRRGRWRIVPGAGAATKAGSTPPNYAPAPGATAAPAPAGGAGPLLAP